ncbi:sporulation membrane protein YtaF [Terribacillus sp. DMT04]|uniref:sporulation membrane protein YtaF n=1 Tax=Terribacillus sp. DMT04 TaxID=2850441 RepID=UPI001C2BBBCF|nr:sporulation membrane protein YtaF [Terribacillus sp. DMT04]QXE00619.1 sporulation membrane protein YtaF [Terribacillus sp. DMT04]
MAYFAGMMLLIIAVSLDGFGVGVTYGMRRIRISLLALLIIMLCSGVTVLTSMSIGSLLTSFIPPDFAEVIGSMILISIGGFSLYNVLRSKKIDENVEEDLIPKNKMENKEWKIEIKKFGLFITVLKKPQMADLDRSGTISAKESLLLGIALALDAFGAGIGAAMIGGYSPVVTAILVALMSGLFVLFGIKSGFVLAKIRCLQKIVYLSPCLLITLGLFKML